MPARRTPPPFLLTAGALALALIALGGTLYWGALRGSTSDTDQPARDLMRSGDGLRRIMLAGDSITQGASGDYTWRYHLWAHLEPHVKGLEFVGPYDGLATNEVILPGPARGEESAAGAEHDYRDPGFDRDHNALWGRTLEAAAQTIGGEVAEYRPDVLCVLIGVNDLLWPIGAAEMEERLRTYVEAAQRSSPGIRIVMAEVPPIGLVETDPGFALRLYVFNELVRSVARETSTEASPVITVDIVQAEGYRAAEDTYDGTHPNAAGERKIAAAFADALYEGLDLAAPYERPDSERPSPRGGAGAGG